MKQFQHTWLMTVVAMLVVACGSQSPLAQAETTEQKAYAAYGTFVIFEEQAAKIVVDPAVPESVKEALRGADRAAKPVADSTLEAVLRLEDLKDEVVAGTATPEQVEAATVELAALYIQLLPLVASLKDVVRGAR